MAAPAEDALPRQLAELAAIHASLRTLTSTLDLPEILRAVLQRFSARTAGAVLGQAASLLLLDPAGRELAFTAARSLQPGVIDGLRLRCDQGIAGWVARHREPVLLEDASRDPRHHAALAERTGLVPRSTLCAPIVKGNALLGVIQVINNLDGSSFDQDELRLVQTLPDHAAIAIENAQL